MVWVWDKILTVDNYAWWEFAKSSDDQYILAISSGLTDTGKPYLSTDAGSTWTELSDLPGKRWRGVACSSNGQYMYCSGGYSDPNVFHASDDYGATWTAYNLAVNGTPHFIDNLVCSDSGQYVAGLTQGLGGNGYVQTSSDYGQTWTAQGNSYPYGSNSDLCMTADGAILLHVYVELPAGKINLSTDSGVSWSEITSIGSPASGYWQNATISSDGQTIYVSTDTGIIKKSTDGGTTWTDCSIGTSIVMLYCDATGDKVLAQGDNVYLSLDGGDTWETIGWTANRFARPSNDWSSVYLVPSGGTENDFMLGYPVDLTIISIDPNEGPTAGGQSVTITGTGFAPLATATIDGNELTSLEVVDHTTITGVTPPGTVGAKDVSVTNP